MIEEGHKVIMLQATDNGDRGVSLEYTVVGEDVSYADEIKLSDSYNSEYHNKSINLKVWYKFFGLYILLCHFWVLLYLNYMYI